MRFERLSGVFRSLRFRLTAWNTAVVLLTVGAALVGIREGLRHTLLLETDQLLADDAEEIAQSIVESYPNLEGVFHSIDRKADAHVHQKLFVQLIGPDGAVVRSTSSTPVERQAISHAVPPDKPLQRDKPSVGGPYRRFEHVLDVPGLPAYTVRVGVSLENVEDDLATLTRLIMIAGAAVLLLAPLGGYWLAGRATHPLARIIRAAARLRPSHMEERLPIRRTGDQLDQLSHTINQFLDQIADYLARNREFVANAAHELRSPLAAIQSSVEVALNADRSTDEYKNLLYEIVDECSRLGVLVNQLLLLAESDAGGLRVQRDVVWLDRLVATSLDMFRGAAEERGIELSSCFSGSAAVLGEAGRLRQVINNLIDNSLKFTPSGGRVLVELGSDVGPAAPGHPVDQVILRVTDSGGGISADDLPHIFERFYRGDKSRHRDDPNCGNGLGLSICQSIVEAHGGAIEVESVVSRGTRFTAYLPAAADDMMAVESGSGVREV
ncbi:MAG TPA: ATP-binding protein [Pirellulales bacterium]|nr:ATP-binding protein [Pirellulales bacterium]